MNDNMNFMINALKQGLKKCAEENKTCYIGQDVISSICKSAIECITKLENENAELKERLDFISKNAEPAGKMLVDMVKREAEKAEQGKVAELKKENTDLKDNLAYAKAVMRELLDNSSEYARQRAMDFLEVQI